MPSKMVFTVCLGSANASQMVRWVQQGKMRMAYNVISPLEVSPWALAHLS